MRSRVFTAVLLMAAASAFAQVTKTPDGYILRVQYTKGSVIRMTVTNKVLGITGQGSAAQSVLVPVTMRVLDVTGHLARVEVRFGEVRIGGALVNKGVTAIAVLNDRNEGADRKMSAPGGARLPIKAVQPGDTWTAKTPVSSGEMSGMVRATYRFVGVNMRAALPVAIVTYIMEGAAQGSGRIELLVKDGTVYSSVSDIKAGALTMHSALKRS